MRLLANADRSCRKGPEAWFTGGVWLDEIVSGAAPSHLKATFVSFAPSARTAWHTHPVGQTLYVTSGLGWVQLQGDVARSIRPGDTAVILPGEIHWHGAQSGHTLVHIALQEIDAKGVDVVWMAHVQEEQYASAFTSQSI